MGLFTTLGVAGAISGVKNIIELFCLNAAARITYFCYPVPYFFEDVEGDSST